MNPHETSWQNLVENFMREKDLDRQRSERGRRNGLLESLRLEEEAEQARRAHGFKRMHHDYEAT